MSTQPHPDGTFQGEIIAVDYEQDKEHVDGLVLCFRLKLEDGHETVAKHRTHGQYWGICKDIIEALGLGWPRGVGRISETIGTTVPVRIKHKPNKSKTAVYENAYIAFGGSQNEPATPDFVKAAVDKMAGAPVTNAAGEPVAEDDIPF